MIVLSVLSYNGAPASGPSASFDELGGTIGRAENNQLVLPDPERTISRVHARVLFRSGKYAIVDNGSNPIVFNGSPLGSGREQVLTPGDRVEIGGYVLEVSAGRQAAAPNDPFADLFGPGAAGGLAVPAHTPAPGRSPMQSWPPASSTAAQAGLPPPQPSASAPGQIPDDWDPFAPEAPAPLSAGAPVAPAARSPGDPREATRDLLSQLPMAPAGGESLDALFGLSGVSSQDPLGATPAQVQNLMPNTAGQDDPLAALSRPAAPVPPATASERGSELNTPMPLPKAPPSGAVFSWDAPAREVHRVEPGPGGPSQTAPGAAAAMVQATAFQPRPAPPPRAELPRTMAAGPGPMPPATPSARPPVTAALPPRPAPSWPPSIAGPEVASDALTSAFREGLGTPGLDVPALTPELMHLSGMIVRESIRGAVELLVARAALKREMRAELTVISARENNPLKFSPSVDVAQRHLFGPPAPGFMPPAAAVRDAFVDLRAHQLGVMAGMKAALEGVLDRFDPKLLESKLTRKSALTSLIPAARKARLWELFTELFQQLQTEAQDDFDELFGKAFVTAYEAQLDRLQREE